MVGKHKLSTFVGGFERPVIWPHVWVREPTTGPERLAIASGEDPLGLLLDLSEHIGPKYSLLYVLAVSRGAVPVGRYESPPLESANVSLFVRDYADFLENDSRHSLWVLSGEDRGMLVYDRHGILYAYGPLDRFEAQLPARGLRKGTFSIPDPHIHHAHEDFDAEAARLLAHWDWERSGLRPED